MKSRNSLVAQWLGLCVLTAKGPALIPGLGTRIPQTMGYGQKKTKQEQTHIHTQWMKFNYFQIFVYSFLFLLLRIS